MRALVSKVILLLLLLSVSESTSERSHSASSRLRGSGAAKHNNHQTKLNNARDLEETDDSRRRKAPHAGGDLRPRAERNENSIMPRSRNIPVSGPGRIEATQTAEPFFVDGAVWSDVPSDVPLFVDSVLFSESPTPEPTTVPTKAPTNMPTQAPTKFPTPFPTNLPTPRPTVPPTNEPTPRPTAFPTWTFTVPEPEIDEAKVEGCGYCQEQGCHIGTNVVTFGNGARASCNRIMEVAPSLTPFQCRIDRATIEEACCCQPVTPIVTENNARLDDPSVPPPPPAPEKTNEAECSFCSGKDFLKQSTVEFSNGSKATCKGLQELLEVGMPPAFCNKERKAIEDACCQPNIRTEPIEVRTLPKSRIDKDHNVDLSTAVSSSRVETDACDFCVGKKFQKDQIINFSTGAKVSCEGLNDLVDVFPKSFCRAEKESIEQTCCPVSDGTVIVISRPATSNRSPPTEARVKETEIDLNPIPSTPVSSQDPCDFCVGQEFLEDPIINFSNMNDSVSCGGLKELVGMGLPPMFCRSQRTNIEATCCRPANTVTTISEQITQAVTVTIDRPVSKTDTTSKSISVSLTAGPSPSVSTKDDETDTISDRSDTVSVSLTAPPSPSVSAEEISFEEATFEDASFFDANQPDTMEDEGSREQTPPLSTDINNDGEDIFSTTTGRVENDNESGSVVSTEHKRKGFFATPTGTIEVATPTGTNERQNKRQGFFDNPRGRNENGYYLEEQEMDPLASAYKKRQGFFADPMGEVEDDNGTVMSQFQNPSQLDDGEEGMKTTGLIKMNPKFDTNNLRMMLQKIKDAIEAHPKHELLFSGGVHRGRAVTSSF